VLVGFVLPIPVLISDKRAGQWWDWQTGPMTIRHAVEPHGDGCRLLIEIRAPAPLERAVALTYGPLIGWVLARLSVLAAES
jgi:hypothetical protein